MIAYETLLDAAARHFLRVAGSPSFTREARHKALELEREARAELDAFNAGCQQRSLLAVPRSCDNGGPAWDGDSEPLRLVA